LYAIGEIVLVVIGILIALQINNWNNLEIEKKEAQKSYLNIRQQIKDDKEELLAAKDFNNYFSAAYEYGSKIISARDHSKIDSLALVAMGLSQYSDFHRSGNIYETLVNSGELRLLKNTEITSAVQRLETTYIFINKLETMHWGLIINELSPELKGVINYTNLQVVKPERLYGVELQNIFFEIIELSKLKDAIYGKAVTEIDTIIQLIDKEIAPLEEPI
jgi:hypothetical protein